MKFGTHDLSSLAISLVPELHSKCLKWIEHCSFDGRQNKHDQLTLKCTARSAWMHCKEKKQKNQLAVKCTTRRSKLLKFIFRKNYFNFGEK